MDLDVLTGELQAALVDPDAVADALAASLVAPQAVRPPSLRWRDATPKDRVTIPCDSGHRVAWWTAKPRTGWLGLQDLDHRGWKWQGEGKPPIRFRGELVDAACACGWVRLGVARQQLPEWWMAPPELL